MWQANTFLLQMHIFITNKKWMEIKNEMKVEIRWNKIGDLK